jgi:hypothetical protein
VTRVDGKPVADREDRLVSLFQNWSEGALKQADKITEESTRFNVGLVSRTVNNPFIVLDALDARNQARFIFSKDGEDTMDRTRVWVLRFVEKTRPTFITTSKGEDEPLTGRAWVEPDSGRLLRAKIDIAAHGQSNATIDDIFHEDARLRLWVPATMTERYTGASGTATYSDYRRFAVETKEELAK